MLRHMVVYVMSHKQLHKCKLSLYPESKWDYPHPPTSLHFLVICDGCGRRTGALALGFKALWMKYPCYCVKTDNTTGSHFQDALQSYLLPGSWWGYGNQTDRQTWKNRAGIIQQSESWCNIYHNTAHITNPHTLVRLSCQSRQTYLHLKRLWYKKNSFNDCNNTHRK